MLEMCVILEVMGRRAEHATCYKVGRKNNAPNPKINAAAGYKGPVKIELLKGTGLLKVIFDFQTLKKGLKNEATRGFF